MGKKEEHTLYADGFDDAILGFSHEWTDTPKVVYSKLKMIEVCEEQGMSVEEAIEYLEYNVWGAYVGDGTPIYADDLAGTKREDIEYTLDLYMGGDGSGYNPTYPLCPPENSPQLSESDSDGNTTEKRQPLEENDSTENGRGSSDKEV
jgi:hypothetical protein